MRGVDEVQNDKCYYLPEMTWPEFAKAIPGVKLAIIPVGSHEQHGPHGTFQFDTAGSREFSILLGKRLYPKAVVAPVVPVGMSGHHMRFPGTITLQAETLVSVLMDMALSLTKHGIRSFLFANGHGGNIPALTIVTNRLRQDHDLDAMWATLPYDAAGDVYGRYVTSPVNGHSCEGEVSVMLHLLPEAVRTEALTPGDLNPAYVEGLKNGVPVKVGQFFDEVTLNGALGDATKASPEIGKAIVEAALEKLVPYLERKMGSMAEETNG